MIVSAQFVHVISVCCYPLTTETVCLLLHMLHVAFLFKDLREKVQGLFLTFSLDPYLCNWTYIENASNVTSLTLFVNIAKIYTYSNPLW